MLAGLEATADGPFSNNQDLVMLGTEASGL